MRNLVLDAYALSNIGLVRANNEDNFLMPNGVFIEKEVCQKMVKGSTLSEYTSSLKGYQLKSTTLFLVADGMGGHNAGEEASREICNFFSKLLKELKKEKTLNEDYFCDAISCANNAVYTKAMGKEKLCGMGATLVLAELSNELIRFYNVGDSTAFLLRNGKLQKMSKNHNVGQMLIDSGLQFDEIMLNYERKKLTKYMGMPAKLNQNICYASDSIEPVVGDIFLLCTDGLTDCVQEKEIESVLADNKLSVEEKACKLREAAFAVREGRRAAIDNITIIVVEIKKIFDKKICK